MTTHVATLNATRGQIEEQLLDGKSPAEVTKDLQEPMQNVLQIFRDLRDDGRIGPQNFPPATPGAVPPRPTHTPNPDLSQRIAGTASLLVKAAEIDDKRIQAALGRARKAMTDLAGLVDKWESKSAARQRIARLEAELRIARAELRDTTPKQQGGGFTSRSQARSKRGTKSSRSSSGSSGQRSRRLSSLRTDMRIESRPQITHPRSAPRSRLT